MHCTHLHLKNKWGLLIFQFTLSKSIRPFVFKIFLEIDFFLTTVMCHLSPHFLRTLIRYSNRGLLDNTMTLLHVYRRKLLYGKETEVLVPHSQRHNRST